MVWGQEEGQSVSVTAKPQRQAPVTLQDTGFMQVHLLSEGVFKRTGSNF